jgi:hypothetical protein
MALHRDRRTGASSLPSRALLVAPWPHPADASRHAAVSPALVEPALSATPPCAREVPHLHMQQTTTADRISIYITYIWTDISKHNINQKHTQTQHTSMIKNLPKRQHHVWVPRKSTPA